MCKFYANNALKTNNRYSIEHLNINCEFLMVIMVFSCLALVSGLTHMLQTFKVFNSVFFKFIFAIFRSFLLLGGLGLSYKLKCFSLIMKIWLLPLTNYWKDKSEPWITNCSRFNAFVCFIIWALNGIFLLFLILSPCLYVIQIFLQSFEQWSC